MARNSGRVCSYFLEGRCRFGASCWNEHPRHQTRRVNQSFPQNAGSSRRGAWNGPSQQYNNPVQPSSFSKSSGSPHFSQNRYAVLSANENVSNSGATDEEEKLLEIIMNDMEIWESSGQWTFSTYSPMKEKPNISGFSDFLPEELRLEYYNCRANNNLQSYINSVQELVNRWRNRLHELRKINASTRTALISELKNVASQPQTAFGFGGSQTSAFGGSLTSAFGAFPVETSAESFSFKTASELASISSTNTPAFGSSAPSSADSHPVGFGNPPSSTAAFSFKTAAPSGGFGTSGFSGFGKPFPASSSTAPSASVFRTGVGSPALNPGQFGQLGGGLESNVAVAPPGSSNSVSSEKLFTPKNELSPEELKQFEARKFTLGKIPLKPPPVELLSI